MTRNRLSSAALAAALVSLTLPSLLVAQPPRGTGRNQVVHEPVLVYEVNGSTLGGEVYTSLTIYTDGDVTLVDDGINEDADVCRATLTQAQVREAVRRLVNAGALRLRDDATQVPDVPLTTVTVLLPGGGGHSLTNTYSYFVPNDRQAAIEDAIQAFIDDTFPDC